MDQDRAARIADLLNRTQRKLRRQTKSLLEPLGVTPSQVRALATVARGGGALRVRDLAERLGVVPRSATSIVDELEAAALVRREPDPADRRATLVTLTERGDKVLQHWAHIRQAAMAELLERLSESDQEDLERLLALLLPSEDSAH